LGIDTLYKFKGFRGDDRGFVLDILEHSRLYFSDADQFNDPFDVSPVIALGGDPEDPKFIAELESKERAIMKSKGMSDGDIERYRAEFGEDVAALAPGARDKIRVDLRADARIYCLSAEQCHPLQWSHYADRHHGLCLHFRSARGSLFGLARKVKYFPDRKPILLPLDRQSDDEIVDRMVLIKAGFWDYEREYRIVAHESLDTGAGLVGRFAPFEPECLVGLTVGLRMQADDRRALFEALDRLRPGLPVWQASEDFGRFWINVDRIR
jgi:hypothetical protein